jgi:hypothetical protein
MSWTLYGTPGQTYYVSGSGANYHADNATGAITGTSIPDKIILQADQGLVDATLVLSVPLALPPTDGTKANVASVSGAFTAGNLSKAADILGTQQDSGVAASVVLPNNAPPVLTGQTSTPGAAAGTLTNAPAVGNPQTWLQVTINGVVHWIPAWHS